MQISRYIQDGKDIFKAHPSMLTVHHPKTQDHHPNKPVERETPKEAKHRDEARERNWKSRRLPRSKATDPG
jgi:hypothetical protein